MDNYPQAVDNFCSRVTNYDIRVTGDFEKVSVHAIFELVYKVVLTQC